MGGVDINDPLCMEFVDQVLGNQFSDMPDTRQSLDQDRGVKFDILQDLDGDITCECQRLIALYSRYGGFCHC